MHIDHCISSDRLQSRASRHPAYISCQTQPKSSAQASPHHQGKTLPNPPTLQLLPYMLPDLFTVSLRHC